MSASEGSRAPYGATSGTGSVQTTESGFDVKAIKQWLKENPDFELERAADEPVYYSTELKDGKLRCLKPEANRKTLNTDYIKDALERPLSLLNQENESLETKYPCPYLDIELECLMKKHEMDGRKFVCQRAVLKEVGLTPYCLKNELDKGVKIAIEQIGETIYLFKYRLDRNQAEHQTERKNPNERVGLMFEHYLTQEPGTPFNPNLKFCALVKARMGSYELAISGEIDCLDENGQLVELKTHKREIEDAHFLERTNWWLQCYLLGVKTIVVGKHDDSHRCTSVKRLPVASDAPAVPQNLRDWVDRVPPTTSQICLGAIHKFLTKVDQHMQRNPFKAERGREIYLFKREPNSLSFSVEKSEDIDEKFIKDETRERLMQRKN